jgi:hypothetical protein
MITIAAIQSTIGGALGSTQGSCLPFAYRLMRSPFKLLVIWVFEIVETGLNAILKSNVSPFEIPPRLPPAWFEDNFKPGPNRSLCSEPFILVPLKPEPN